MKRSAKRTKSRAATVKKAKPVSAKSKKNGALSSRSKRSEPRRVLVSSQAPEPIGPYSQAVQIGSFVFCSGQIAIDIKTQVALASLPVADQAERAINQIKAVLGEAGMTLADVVKTTIFLIDMGDFQAVNEVYGRHFSAPFPARSTVAVAGLPKGVRVEIEVIAFRS